MKNIYIVGSLNTDLVISSQIPQKGETIRGKDFFMNCGGKGANQAAAAAKLGGKVYMAGCVGVDPFGKNMKENLKDFGADVSCVREEEGVSSGVAIIVITTFTSKRSNFNAFFIDNSSNRAVLNTGRNNFISRPFKHAYYFSWFCRSSNVCIVYF